MVASHTCLYIGCAYAIGIKIIMDWRKLKDICLTKFKIVGEIIRNHHGDWANVSRWSFHALGKFLRMTLGKNLTLMSIEV